MATILIVEDERLIADEIGRALRRLGHAPLAPVATSDDALQALRQHPAELVLMDIAIAGDCDGIATALLVRRQFALPVVFLTAHSDAATLNRAKVAQPAGYLLKPFTDDSLRAQVELALYTAYPPPVPVAPEAATATVTLARNAFFAPYLFVRKGAGHVKVLLTDVRYFEALQNFVRLHTATENFVFDATLKELEQKLPAAFFRTHRSYLVNLDHVHAYQEGYVQLGAEYLPVSRSSKEALKNRLQLLG